MPMFKYYIVCWQSHCYMHLPFIHKSSPNSLSISTSSQDQLPTKYSMQLQTYTKICRQEHSKIHLLPISTSNITDNSRANIITQLLGQRLMNNRQNQVSLQNNLSMYHAVHVKIFKQDTYPSCVGGYSHSSPFGNIPVVNKSHIGIDGGSVWTLAVG